MYTCTKCTCIYRYMYVYIILCINVCMCIYIIRTYIYMYYDVSKECASRGLWGACAQGLCRWLCGVVRGCAGVVRGLCRRLLENTLFRYIIVYMHTYISHSPFGSILLERGSSHRVTGLFYVASAPHRLTLSSSAEQSFNRLLVKIELARGRAEFLPFSWSSFNLL